MSYTFDVSPLTYSSKVLPEINNEKISLKDISLSPKYGIKGKNSIALLEGLGVAIPTEYNSAIIDNDNFIMRLGTTEFLIDGSLAEKLVNEQTIDGAYFVLHQDACLELSGTKLNDMLQEICAVNFKEFDAQKLPVILTSMVGVGVVTLLYKKDGKDTIRLYADPTYSAYFYKTLSQIANEIITRE